MKLDFDKFIVKPGKKVNLKDYDTGFTAGLKKKNGVKELQKNTEELPFCRKNSGPTTATQC